VASFNDLTVHTVGSGYKLTASSGTLTSATSYAFDITHGTASKLAFTGQPSNTTAGASVTPAVQVTVQDAYANTVTDGSGSGATISLALSGGDPAASLGGTTSKAATNGVASFGNLSANRVGTAYKLGATSSPLTGATSSSFNVTAAQTTTTLTLTGSPVQYSDKLTALSATITPASLASGVENVSGTVRFMAQLGTNTPIQIASATVSANAGVATAAPTPMPQLLLAPGNYFVWAVFTSGSSQFTDSTSTKPTAPNLTVSQEDALATYTGDMLIFTSTSAPVTLRATIQDITAANPAGPDQTAGDIRNAKVDLRINGAAPAGCAGLSPTLIASSDPKTGSVSCTTTLSSGTSSTEYTVSVVVTGYYQDTTDGDLGVVEVAQPNGTFITGGGYLVSTTSGKYGSSPATSRTNYGFNVKYNKSGTNPQGHVNIIFRTGGRVYQIQSNSTNTFGTSLQTPPPASSTCAGPPNLTTCWGVANFNANANITDVTNPSAPVSVPTPSGHAATLQLALTDKGDPGSADTVVISLWDGSTLLWSTNANGASTAQQTITGGNLVVH
jgi:hypothetical protein